MIYLIKCDKLNYFIPSSYAIPYMDKLIHALPNIVSIGIVVYLFKKTSKTDLPFVLQQLTKVGEMA